MRRWLVLSLGLGIAAAAGFALLTTRAPRRDAPAPSVAPDSAALDEIDAASRARLEKILREAGREDAAAREGSEQGNETREGSRP
jgi:hypothetical protein